MAISLPVDLPGNLKSIQPYLEIADDYESKDPCISYWCRLYALKQGFILETVEEDLSFLLVLMEVLEKNKQDLQSKIEINDIPVARAHLEGVTEKLLSWAENVPPLESLTKCEILMCVVAKVFQSAGMLLDVCSIFGKPSEGEFEKKKYTDLNEKNLHNEHSALTTRKANIYHPKSNKLAESLADGISVELQNDEKKNTGSPPTTARDDDENQAQSPKVTKQDEQKKIYDRLFLLQLLNHPVSQKKPDGLPSLEIVQNKMGRNRIIAGKLLNIHRQQSQLRTNFNPKKICLIYRIVRKDREEQKMELNNPQSQEPFGPMGGRSCGGSSDYRWNSLQNIDSRGGCTKLDMKELRIPKASRDADQGRGQGVTSWRRVASSDTAQSLIGGVGGCKQKQNSGFFGLRSQQPSREKSVIRPVFRETARPPTLSRGANSSIEEGNSESLSVLTDFQHSLEKNLRDATQLTTDDICSWIKKQYVEVNSAFIRALVTVVSESSIEGRGTDSKLNSTVLKNWTELLRRYVDNIADHELQLLYAVQALVTHRQHPKGLMQGICETL